MNTRTSATITLSFTIIGKALLAALLLFVTFYATPAEAQATDPSATATVGVLRIGTGNFTEYKPTHIQIHAGDSVLQDVIGNLQMGTDSSGKECTLDPNQPAPAWSWTYTSTYSTDGTNYEPIGSNGSLSVTGGQTGKLFGTFSTSGYFKIKFMGHVTFYTNCKSGAQSLNTIELEENFSADKQDFDFSVSDLAINQGEDGTFFSTLSSINGFTGTINFSNPDPNDPLFGVTGSGFVSPSMLGTAPITIHVGSGAIVGRIYAVGIRGKSNVGPTTIFHDKVATITVLKRAVTIDCPTVGTTKYRLPAITGPVITNVRQPDGSMRGDTVKPASGSNTTLTYNIASLTGYWSKDNTYKWNSSIADANNKSSLTLNWSAQSDIQSFSYNYNNPLSTDAVSLLLSDHGHSATGSYAMNFHDEFEPISWPESSSYKVMTAPDPEAPGWPTYPWKAVIPSITASYPYGKTINFSYSEKGFKDVDGGLELGKEPVVVHFGFTYQFKDEMPLSVPLTANPPLQYHQMTWCVYRENVTRHKGYLDHYGTSGYIGRGMWRRDETMGIDPSLMTPYQPTDAPITDPPPGWNPPGY